MHLILYELKKINVLRWFAGILCLIAIPGIVMTFLLTDQEESEWRIYASAHKAELKQMIAITDPQDEQYEEICAVFQNEIDTIDYCLKHDLVYGCQSVWSYMYRSKFLLGIVTIALIVLAGNSISVERRCNMEEKVLSGKYTSGKLLKNKLSALWLTEFAAQIAGSVVLFLIGIVLFGHIGQYFSAEWTDGIVVKNDLIKSTLLYVLISMIAALIYISLSVILEMLFPDKKIVSVLVILLFLFNGTLETISEKIHMERILPFFYLDASQYSYDITASALALRLVYLMVLLLLLLGVSFFIAKRCQYKK